MINKTIFTFLFMLSAAGIYAQQLEWGKSFGSTNREAAYSIAVDQNGNVYTTGYFYDAVDFDPGPGILELTTEDGNDNSFISKFDANGNFQGAISFKGGYNEAYAIAIDDAGYLYIMGYFDDTVDFDPGSATHYLTGTDATFITKLDSDGAFVWCKTFDNASGLSIVVKDDFLYSAGVYTGSVDFDPGAAVENQTAVGFGDAYVLKLDTDGNFQWVKSMGGTGYDVVKSVAIDQEGNVILTGYFFETADFAPGGATYELTAAGYSDGFIAKLNPEGYFTWAQSFGGTGYDKGNSVALDNMGNSYVGGYFHNSFVFDLGPANLAINSNGNYDALLVKYSPTGEIIWAKSIGGSEFDEVYSIALDPLNNLIVAGYYENTVDLNPGVNVHEVTSSGSTDIFLTSLNPSGLFQWGTSFGGTGEDYVFGLATDSHGNIYTTGFFEETVNFAFPPFSSEFTSMGDEDAFIQKISPDYAGSDEHSSSGFMLYPNPADHVIHLDTRTITGHIELYIYNCFGELVHFQDIPETQSVTDIDTDFPPGVYVIVASATTGQFQQKFIKR